MAVNYWVCSQHIYLSDDSIIANIAFGVSSEDIDYDSIERVAKIANLHEFVINKLPKKYQTKVGERGKIIWWPTTKNWNCQSSVPKSSSASFGRSYKCIRQCNRTSCYGRSNNLDKDNIIVIMIAHRLSTVKECDNFSF